MKKKTNRCHCQSNKHWVQVDMYNMEKWKTLLSPFACAQLCTILCWHREAINSFRGFYGWVHSTFLRLFPLFMSTPKISNNSLSSTPKPQKHDKHHTERGGENDMMTQLELAVMERRKLEWNCGLCGSEKACKTIGGIKFKIMHHEKSWQKLFFLRISFTSLSILLPH